MYIGILFILIMAACALGAILFVSVAAIAASRRASGDEHYCGRCGYCARGLAESRCPECGSNFNDVGLNDRPPGRNWRGAAYVVAWALLAPIVFYIAAVAILDRAPVLTHSYAFEVWHGPQSGAYDQVYIEYKAVAYTGVGGKEVQRRSDWQVRFETAASSIDLHGDALKGEIVVTRGSSSKTMNAQLSERTIAELIEGAISGMDSDAVAREARDVHGFLAHAMNPVNAKPPVEAFERVGNSGWSRYRTPHRAFGFSVLGSFVALWVVGLVTIVWWARRPSAPQ